jgi:hypothetical protein
MVRNDTSLQARPEAVVAAGRAPVDCDSATPACGSSPPILLHVAADGPGFGLVWKRGLPAWLGPTP